MSWPRIGFRVRATLRPSDRWNLAGGELDDLVRVVAAAGADTFFIAATTAQSRTRFVRERGSADPFVTLAALASADRRVGLGCLAVSIEDWPPSMLAKMITGLDLTSAGRAALAVTPSGDEQSVERFAEAVEVIRAMLRLPEPSLNGRHFQITKAWNEPRSTRDRPIPLGVLIDERLAAGRIADTLQVAARLCDFGVIAPVSSRAAIVADHVTSFSTAAARAGRLPKSAGLLLLVGMGDDDDLAALTDRFERARFAGYDGVVIDWRTAARPIDEGATLVEHARQIFGGTPDR